MHSQTGSAMSWWLIWKQSLYKYIIVGVRLRPHHSNPVKTLWRTEISSGIKQLPLIVHVKGGDANSRILTECWLQSVRSESQSTLAILTSVRPGKSFLDRSSHAGARFLQWPHLQVTVGGWLTFKRRLHSCSWEDLTTERRTWQKSGPRPPSPQSSHSLGSINWTAKRKEWPPFVKQLFMRTVFAHMIVIIPVSSRSLPP